MRSTCTTKKRGWSVQVEWKWCSGLNRDNLQHKLYTTHNLWEEAPPPPYNIFYASPRGLHLNVTFPQDSQVGVPKLGLLLSQNFGHLYHSQIESFLRVRGHYYIALENLFSMVYSTLQSNLI
jgi:hypothetical protein